MKNDFPFIDIISELIVLFVSVILVSIFSAIFAKQKDIRKKYTLISFINSLLLALFLIHSNINFNIHF